MSELREATGRTTQNNEHNIIAKKTLVDFATRVSIVLICLLFIFLIVLDSKAIQKYSANAKPDHHLIVQVEDLIIAGKKDSAKIILQKWDKSEYSSVLSRIVNNSKTDYADLRVLIKNFNNRNGPDFKALSRFIDSAIVPPTSHSQIDIDYVYVKWFHSTIIRDEFLDLNEASAVNDELEAYIDMFDPQDQNVMKARVLANVHKIVMALIQAESAYGKRLCAETRAMAEALNDTNLIILSLYHYSDFLIPENKLDEYIEISEHCYTLDQQLKNKSSYYLGNLEHLINAYVFKGGFEKRVSELLKELYNAEGGRLLSYSLYAQLMATLPKDHPVVDNILSEFGVGNVKEFCDLIINEAQEKLNRNDLYILLRESARALVKSDYSQEGVEYMEHAVSINKEIYSEELSKQIADYETNLIRKEKELEIAHEHEQKSLYIVIASLASVLLVVTIIAFIYSLSKTKTLQTKNDEIQLQKVELEKSREEKEILLKELQHRVKNNFQIILNLLDMQSANIDNVEAIGALREGQNRLKSMAFIHQTLIQNADMHIRFDKYINRLVTEISNSFKLSPAPVLQIETPELDLDIDTAIPLGLIINELVTNAFKYGFSESDKKLYIHLRKKEDIGGYALCISDNGKGLPANHDIANSHSLGLRLVSRLAKQLHGEFTISNSDNCQLNITFKDKAARESEEV
ncbi:MAG: sensor histidine kinase [Cyclobacteriaceae bacterium]